MPKTLLDRSRFWWRDLPVARKLYTVFGIMAFLIGFELLVLSFAMNTLSSVRAFVAGEGHWSKAQKDAINSLHKYIITSDSRYYLKYKKFLEIPEGDKEGLIEVEKTNPDKAKLYRGFLKGRNHRDDIEGMVKLLRRFSNIKYIEEAITAWKAANNELNKLTVLAEEIHQEIQKGDLTEAKIKEAVIKLDIINDDLTVLENRFSDSLSEGSRWLEGWLFFILLLLVLTVEVTGLTFTMTFSHHLSKVLKKLTVAADQIGAGDFEQRVDIESKDELGQLAASINKMAQQLKSNVGLRKEAEHSSKVKSLFLANMSHEIRTPLSSIMGFAELLKNDNLSKEDKHKYLEVIQSAGENLSNVINDILDISKVESGHLTIEIDNFSLLKLLDDLKNLTRFKCNEKGVYLKFIIDEKLPNFIKTDPIRLRQVLLNLLSNAIKFTDSGEIRLVAYTKNGMLIFDVFDTGMGIPQEDQSLIFQRFRQSDNSLNRKHGGTGLGLPLSRHLTHLLGGNLELVHSEINKGSHFRAQIHYEIVREAEVERIASTRDERAQKVELAGLKLLIAEDSEEIRMLLDVILNQWGCVVDFAEDGVVALDKVKSNQYDIILLDIQMPRMNGFETVKKMRKELHVDSPILAQTAHAMREEKEKCLASGFDDVITKPIKMEELVRMLAQYSTGTR